MTNCRHEECEFGNGWKLLIIIALISSCTGPSNDDIQDLEQDLQLLKQTHQTEAEEPTKP